MNLSTFFLFQDLLKHTPSSHPDHPLLQDALRISQNFLSSINEEITPRRQSMTVKKGEVSVESLVTISPLVIVWLGMNTRSSYECVQAQSEQRVCFSSILPTDTFL